jgi:septal ring factor EnvC (AmiA/AmiB activator)
MVKGVLGRPPFSRQNTESLRTANEARDRALLDHWPEEIEGLERERNKAVQELTELRQQLSEVCGELKQARQDRLRVVDSNDKKRHGIEAWFNTIINQLRCQLENARRPT